MKRECLRCILLALVTALLLAATVSEGRGEPDEQYPPLSPKPYRIGIAPSHITTSPDVLFSRPDEWSEVRGAVDHYKYYSLQVVPPKWATKLSLPGLIDRAKADGFTIGAEFGSFVGIPGRQNGHEAAIRAVTMHRPVIEAGGSLLSLHVDGAIRRMLDQAEGRDGLSLEQAAAEVALFFKEFQQSYPETEIGLITNFPNWDYTTEFPGFNGHYTDRSGVTYAQALEAVHRTVGEVGRRIAFVEVDCPYNYYAAERTRNGDAPLDNAGKFLALQSWCKAREIRFHLVLNFDHLTPFEEGQPRDRALHDQTLAYVRHLRRDAVFPDTFIFQSWYTTPVKHLPETEPYTFTYTARAFIRLVRELYPAE